MAIGKCTENINSYRTYNMDGSIDTVASATNTASKVLRLCQLQSTVLGQYADISSKHKYTLI